ncbi:MAG: sporulation protein YabP [Peptococcaceae bacterium]|jgi:sporulation protein YabP|nr:sporulation protein YabP [Peptococcaceae bacterium]MDR2736113.1 sporulation protein YabP [Gracilibacteraceae bacterium]
MIEQRSGLKPGLGASKHTLTMIGRHTLKVTGVGSVKSFDEKEIHLETLEGTLVISGEELGVKNLNLEQSQVEIEGAIRVLSYMAAHVRRKKIMERLFK